jgi:hypothetical protein
MIQMLLGAISLYVVIAVITALLLYFVRDGRKFGAGALALLSLVNLIGLSSPQTSTEKKMIHGALLMGCAAFIVAIDRWRKLESAWWDYFAQGMLFAAGSAQFIPALAQWIGR